MTWMYRSQTFNDQLLETQDQRQRILIPSLAMNVADQITCYYLKVSLAPCNHLPQAEFRSTISRMCSLSIFHQTSEVLSQRQGTA